MGSHWLQVVAGGARVCYGSVFLWRGWTCTIVGIKVIVYSITLYGCPKVSSLWLQTLVVFVACHDVLARGSILVAKRFAGACGTCMSMYNTVSMGPEGAGWVQFGFIFLAALVFNIRVVVVVCLWLVAQLFDEGCCDVSLSLELLSERLVGFS